MELRHPQSEPLSRWTSQARTRRGERICIRPLQAVDRADEAAFVDALSEQSRYFRFFRYLKSASPELLDELMNVDYHSRMAFVATADEGKGEHIVGVAGYNATEQPGTAEFAVAVSDRWQRRGIARMLVERLAQYAHAHGVQRLSGLVLPDNLPMITFARGMGFHASYDSRQHLVRIVRDLTPRAAAVAVRLAS